MGYAPLFDTLTKGTLCGRWPDIGLWPIVLSLGDRYGVVDVTPTYIASVTGLPIEEVSACMKRFCEPDPRSRSSEEKGARLVLIDEHRDWGWRIVNHASYREKARKAAFDAARTESGRDAERKRHSREVPTRPAKSRADPPSDSNTNTDSDKNSEPRSVEQKLDGGPVDRVFDHWRSEFRHPKASLDPKRRRAIQRALESYDEPSLCTAISGYKLSPHHMGQNDQRTVYDDISLFLRDAEHIERGMNFARAPPVAAKSAVEVARENLQRSRNGGLNGSVVSDQDGRGESHLGTVARVLR